MDKVSMLVRCPSRWDLSTLTQIRITPVDQNSSHQSMVTSISGNQASKRISRRMVSSEGLRFSTTLKMIPVNLAPLVRKEWNPQAVVKSKFSRSSRKVYRSMSIAKAFRCSGRRAKWTWLRCSRMRKACETTPYSSTSWKWWRQRSELTASSILRSRRRIFTVTRQSDKTIQ